MPGGAWDNRKARVESAKKNAIEVLRLGWSRCGPESEFDDTEPEPYEVSTPRTLYLGFVTLIPA